MISSIIIFDESSARNIVTITTEYKAVQRLTVSCYMGDYSHKKNVNTHELRRPYEVWFCLAAFQDTLRQRLWAKEQTLPKSRATVLGQSTAWVVWRSINPGGIHLLISNKFDTSLSQPTLEIDHATLRDSLLSSTRLTKI